MERSEFSVEFKTTAEDGVLMYVDDQKPSPIDFLAIYMKNGHLVYAFNPGSGPAVVRSPLKYVKLPNVVIFTRSVHSVLVQV